MTDVVTKPGSESPMATRTAYPHLPAVRGRLRPRDHACERGPTVARRSPGSAATWTTCSATASSARRARRSSSCTRIPTACGDRWSKRDGEFVEVTWAEAWAAVDAGLPVGHRRPRPRRRGGLPRQPERPQHRRRCSTPRASSRRSARPTCSRPAPSTSGPRRSPPASCSAASPCRCPTSTAPTSCCASGPTRSRPTAASPPRRTGRDASKRSSSGAASSSSSTPAAAAPPRPPRSGSPSGPAPTPTCSPPSPTCWSPTGLVDLGAVAEHLNGYDEVVAAVAPFTPEAVADGHRRRRGDDPRPGAPAGRGAERGGVRPHRHHHPGLRHRRRAGSSTSSTSSPATSTGPAARCSPRPPPARPTPAARRASVGACRSTGATAGSSGLPETLGELPVAGAGRGDRDARRGPDPGPGHHRRQPGAVDAERRAPRRGPRQSSTSWCRSTSTSTRRPATPT